MGLFSKPDGRVPDLSQRLEPHLPLATGFSLCCAWLLGLALSPLFLGILLFLAFASCCCAHPVHKFSLYVMTHYPPTSVSPWSLFWRALFQLTLIFNGLTLTLKCGGDMRRYLESLKEKAGGGRFVYLYGVAASTHAEVAEALRTAERKRELKSSTMAAPIPSDPGFSAHAVGYMDGERHKILRKFIYDFLARPEVVAANSNQEDFNKDFIKEFLDELPQEPNWKKGKDRDAAIQLYCRCMFKMILDVELRKDELHLTTDYCIGLTKTIPSWKVACFPLSGPKKKHAAVSRKLAEIVRQRGSHVQEYEEMAAGLDLDDVVLYLATYVALFGGSFGGSKMVADAFAEMDENPERVQEMINSPDNFVWEVARMFSGIDVVAHTLQTPQTRVVFGKSYTLPVGTQEVFPLHLAHMDEDVFPDPYHFKVDRDNYDQVVAWNGLGRDGPRVCPGLDISYNLIKAILLAYANHKNATATP